MKILKLVAGGLIAGVTIFSCKKEDESISKVLNAADLNFISLASLSNHSQIAMAKVAVSNASDSVVLSFAQYLLAEHTRANNDLKSMGTFVGFTVKDTTDAAHDSIINRLIVLKGRPFDSTFIHTELADHTSMINVYRQEVSKGLQVNVKNYANVYLQNFAADYQQADSIATRF